MESMHPQDHNEGPGQAHGNSSASRAKWVFWGFVAVAAFFLLTEHRAHLLGILPFLLVLACPLMHLFHHGRHGGSHGSHGNEAPGPSAGERK